MTKEEALAAIKLLSALESWALSQANRLPEYLHEDLCKSMEVLEKIVLAKQHLHKDLTCAMAGLEKIVLGKQP